LAPFPFACSCFAIFFAGLLPFTLSCLATDFFLATCAFLPQGFPALASFAALA
jgi:hypothetical protein